MSNLNHDLVQRYERRLLTYCRKLTRDYDQALDLSQQTWVRFRENGWTRERMEQAVQERAGKRKSTPRAEKLLFKAGETSVSLAGGNLNTWAEALTALLRKVKQGVSENLDTAAFAATIKNGTAKGGTKHV